MKFRLQNFDNYRPLGAQSSLVLFNCC